MSSEQAGRKQKRTQTLLFRADVGRAPHLADKVGHVEGGHDEDGEPLPEEGVPDLRLQAGEQTQSDAVGDADGQHVGPDDAGHHVTMQDHVWSEDTHTHTHMSHTPLRTHRRPNST